MFTKEGQAIKKQLEDRGYSFDITRNCNTDKQLRYAMIHYLVAEIGLDYDEMESLTDEELLEKIIY